MATGTAINVAFKVVDGQPMPAKLSDAE